MPEYFGIFSADFPHKDNNKTALTRMETKQAGRLTAPGLLDKIGYRRFSSRRAVIIRVVEGARFMV
ncbi:hypothetical protein SAMN02745216_00283 [Desulfatibacillum alkenivorans DSM 16219]|uniref:Uncharacterized protein n=1 Tax=Desulfatibacillum alkenivorans DSM 16219 TaxID=1121393 RepID=A0A1M6CN99_9BACT|nr:hypothetical protein SAMN02745216_00283 [Desulfatibacillum alkenivorans DSM 16219]